MSNTIKEVLHLDWAIVEHIRMGYHIVSQSECTVQMQKPKSFSCLFATLGLILGVVPLIVYLIIYASEEDSLVLLRKVSRARYEVVMRQRKAQLKAQASADAQTRRYTWILVVVIFAVCIVLCVLVVLAGPVLFEAY